MLAVVRLPEEQCGATLGQLGTLEVVAGDSGIDGMETGVALGNFLE
jgi:hypothetical protein